MPSVFYIGATGYIGGSALVRLIKRYPDWNINALVRKEKSFEYIQQLGVTIIEGSFSDEALVTEQSRMADIVINISSADNLSLITAILAGMKQRFNEGRPKGTFIHTSGCGVFYVDGKMDGKLDPSGRVWNDANEDDMKSITTSQWHGPVDVSIFEAGEQGYVNTYIICPSGVVGTPPAEAVMANNGAFLKFITQTYIKAKRGVYVGDGTNRFQFIHIDDLVDYYMRIVDIAVNGKDAGASSYARYFIATAISVPWKEVATAVAEDLHRRSILESPALMSVTKSELELYEPLALMYSLDLCAIAGRGKGLGWEPRHVVLTDYIKESMDGILDAISAD
ncbi:hypothetical protein OF83DRAFT_1176159 [Amylostereum chailletii]|nr:hypothetical protein OF83DRAFT_1176159 [Amylostereum chailletii]